MYPLRDEKLTISTIAKHWAAEAGGAWDAPNVETQLIKAWLSGTLRSSSYLTPRFLLNSLDLIGVLRFEPFSEHTEVKATGIAAAVKPNQLALAARSSDPHQWNDADVRILGLQLSENLSALQDTMAPDEWAEQLEQLRNLRIDYLDLIDFQTAAGMHEIRFWGSPLVPETKPRQTRTEDDAAKARIFRNIVACAHRRWARKPKSPGWREIAVEIIRENPWINDHYQVEAVVQILRGSYPKMMRLGINGMKR